MDKDLEAAASGKQNIVKEGKEEFALLTRPPTPINQIPPKNFSPSHQFISQDDSLNPVTSRTTRDKVIFLISLSLPAFAVPFASTIYAPLVDRLTQEYHTSRIVYQLTISLSVVGFGIAPVALTPLSEVWGRKPVLVTSSMLFTGEMKRRDKKKKQVTLIFYATLLAAFNIGTIFAQNIQTLIILRFFAFLLGGVAVTLCIATLTDVSEASRKFKMYADEIKSR